MMTLRAVSATCILACLATATAPTARHIPPKLILQRRTQGTHAISWTTTTLTSKTSITSTTHNPASFKPLPESATPTATDGARVTSASGSKPALQATVRPRYRYYSTSSIVYTSTAQSSPVCEADSSVYVKAAPNTTSAPVPSTVTPPASIWHTTSTMTCDASGEWNTGHWGSLSAHVFDAPVPDVASTPLLGKYSVVMSDRQRQALMWLAAILVWGLLFLISTLGHCSYDKPIVEVVEEATLPVEDDDAAEYDNAIGVPDMDAVLALLKAKSNKNPVRSFLASFSPKQKVVRRHSMVNEGDALEISQLFRRSSAPAARKTSLSSLFHRPRRASMMEEERIRSESNQPRLAQSSSVNIDAPAAAAAAAALVGQEGEDTPVFVNPILLTPLVRPRLEKLLDIAAVTQTALVAIEAEVQEELEGEMEGSNAQGVKPTKMDKLRAAFGGACASAKKLFKGGNTQAVETFILADRKIENDRANNNTPLITVTRAPTLSTSDVAAFRFNPDALADRKAVLRAAAASTMSTILDTSTPAAAAAASPVVQITCDYDDDEPGDFFPVPPFPVLTRRLSWLNVSQSGPGGIFSCEDLELTVVPPAVLPVEGEDANEMAAPVLAPAHASAVPSRKRGLSDMFFDMLDKSGSSGGMIASFAVIETGAVPVEGGREGGVVAPVVAPAVTRKRKLSMLDVLSLSGGGSLPSYGVVETAMRPVEAERKEEVAVGPVEAEEEEEEEEEEEMPTFF